MDDFRDEVGQAGSLPYIVSLRRAYIILLRLYPRDYRASFSVEMTGVFAEAVIDRRRQGWAATIGFVLREMAGLVTGAWSEWVAKLVYSVCHTNSYVSGRGLPDRLFMRPCGVAWESYYFLDTASDRASDKTGSAGGCVNAYQRFLFGSTLRRLVMLIGGGCGCGRR